MIINVAYFIKKLPGAYIHQAYPAHFLFSFFPLSNPSNENVYIIIDVAYRSVHIHASSDELNCRGAGSKGLVCLLID